MTWNNWTTALQINCYSTTSTIVNDVCVCKSELLFFSQTKTYIEFPFKVLRCVHFSHSFNFRCRMSSSSSSSLFHFIWSDEKNLFEKLRKQFSRCDVISNITDLVTHILISIDANCRNIITINIHFIGYYFKACINQRNNNRKKKNDSGEKTVTPAI